MLPDDFQMPAFRDPDGTVFVWDDLSHTYVRKPDEGLEQDRGHSTGGDNDLFNQDQLEHSELAGAPTLEGYMASSYFGLEFQPGQMIHVEAQNGHEFPLLVQNADPDHGWVAADQDGNRYTIDDTGNVYDLNAWSGEHFVGTISGSSLSDPGINPDAPGEMTLSDMGIPPEGENYYRTAAEWAPQGKVLCPQCHEPTNQHVCPICGKDLTPEWNNEADKNSEFFGTHPTHDNTTEHHTFPDREPKRNRMKTDDSYPSMSLSKMYEVAQKLAAHKLSQDDEDWDDFFSSGGSKVEIGKWLLDRSGQLHFDHGMHALHEKIAARDGLRYPEDVAALGSVYNDGTADTQRVFPGALFNQEAVQAQVEQAFGPVQLQAPVSHTPEETKGAAFAPFEIEGGQWIISPVQAQNGITGVAWIKEKSQTPYSPTMILVTEHLQPEDYEIYSQGARAIITATGGLTSHAAYLASTEGTPVIVGVGPAYNKIESGNYLKIDPQRQVITVMPGADASMSPAQKQQISDAYINYQMAHGGSYLGENPDWIKITTANLEDCPECNDVMYDQDGEKVCHGCGHKQPIIVHNAAVLAPLGEAAIGGLAEAGAGAGIAGGEAGGAGLLGGGSGISGIGGLMQRALSGNPLQTAYYGDRLMGGGGHGGGSSEPNEEVETTDPSSMQGVISKTAGVWGDIIEAIVKAIGKAPEAFVDPKNPLSYADDIAGGLASAGTGSANNSPIISKVGYFDFVSTENTFGNDDVGLATKNRGENSDPDHQSSSGDSPKEFGDSPEQLKDIDGAGNADKDSAPADDLKNQGDPGLQEKALKSLHMNLPLVIEFSESSEAGSDNPIISALDQILEEAFPGYKDGHDPLAEELDHPQDSDDGAAEGESEDESGEKPETGDSKDPQGAPKEASVWHYAFGDPGFGEQRAVNEAQGMEPQGAYVCPNCGYSTNNNEYTCPNCGTELEDHDDPYTDHLRELDDDQAPGHYELYGPDRPTWSDMFPHEGATKESYGPEPLSPGMTPVGTDNGIANATAPVCPYCGQTHAPGTACPQGATRTPVTAPAANGAPVTPPQPNTVVTKWQVVSVDTPSPVENVVECHFVTLDEARAAVDPEFAFYTASDEQHHEHEVEHHPDLDSDGAFDDDGGDDIDASPWVDESGHPLTEGADYEMKASNYAIPDRVTIDRVLPDKIIYTIHTGDVDYQDEVTKEQLATDGVTFGAIGDGEAPYDSEDGFQDYEAPIRPGQDAIPQVDDLTTPSTVVSSTEEFEPISLDTYTGSFHGDVPDSRSWLTNDSSPVAVDPSLMAKFAGKNYSPREQREFIDEKGEARNLDRLDLTGTHYVMDDLDNEFNW